MPDHPAGRAGNLTVPGNADLITLIKELCMKPGRRTAENRPILCLVRTSEQQRLAKGLSALLGGGAVSAVPHALVDVASLADAAQSEEPCRVRLVEKILVDAANRLANMGDPSVRRFRRLALLIYLMSCSVPNVGLNDQKRKLREKLRRSDRFGMEVPNDPAVPQWLRLIGVFVPLVWSHVRLSGRVPFFGSHYRWFLRQPYAPTLPRRGFMQLAVELTDGRWQTRKSDEMINLLVGCFVADIREHYETSWWRLNCERTTTYCVLLLDNVAPDNGGEDVLRALDDNRNAVSGPEFQRDPLLIVSMGASTPAQAATHRSNVDPNSPLTPAAEAANVYERRFGNAVRGAVNWYLPIEIREPDSDVPLGQRPMARPLVPWYARRAVALSLIVLLLITAGVCYLRLSSTCGELYASPAQVPDVESLGGECVGLSDGSFPLFSLRDAETDAVLDRVRTQNEMAVAAHRKRPERPYISIVYLGALTSASDAEGLAAERGGIEGAAVAQDKQLRADGANDPIVRVLIGNAGSRMQYGYRVAQQISDLAKEDPSVVGVVGLSQSRRPTADTVAALAANGIPVVSATLSSDQLATDHLMYYQIAPQNIRSADVAAALAGRMTSGRRASRIRGPAGNVIQRRVRVYYSEDSTDTYSQNLYRDVKEKFTAQGFAVEGVSYTPEGGVPPGAATPSSNPAADAGDAGGRSCGYGGLVYFAGRPIPEFGEFLDRVEQCAKKPSILADDDVSRYVASSSERREHTEVPFWYTSFAVAPSQVGRTAVASNFYSTLGRLFPFENNPEDPRSRSLDGHAALSYDATRTMIVAARYLRLGDEHIPISPAAVWREIADIHDDPHAENGHRALRGASGNIDFGGGVRLHVPLNKPVYILQVRNGQVDPDVVASCGAPEDGRTQSWCPKQRSPN